VVHEEHYLIDKSAFERLNRPEALELWQGPLVQGRIGICWPTEAEILYSARSPKEYRQVKAMLGDLYTWVPEPDGVGTRVLDLLDQLSDRGFHRSASVVDLQVAVMAAVNGLTVLHYDRDFDTVAKVTGQPTQWLMPPGTF
jgi:predicted nucleic acid-binding protein